MAQKQSGEMKPETRRIVSAVLFAIAGTLLVVLIIMLAVFRDELNGGATTNTPTAPISTQTRYEKVDLQDMLDELNANALRAEEKYQGKYIEITGKIKLFDSDGMYVALTPYDAAEWSFEMALCYLTDPTHKTFLLEKNVGDMVTVRGKVFSIGEVIGYGVRIVEIS